MLRNRSQSHFEIEAGVTSGRPTDNNNNAPSSNNNNNNNNNNNASSRIAVE